MRLAVGKYRQIGLQLRHAAVADRLVSDLLQPEVSGGLTPAAALRQPLQLCNCLLRLLTRKGHAGDL